MCEKQSLSVSEAVPSPRRAGLLVSVTGGGTPCSLFKELVLLKLNIILNWFKLITYIL